MLKHLPLVWDVFEVAAVFFLAVEAIKIKNLQWIRSRAIPLYNSFNPLVVFVDVFPKKYKFFNRYAFESIFIGLYVVGAIAGAIALQALGISVETLTRKNENLELQVYAKIGILIAPLCCGMLIFSVPAWLLRLVIEGLSRIEANTRNGAVGIMGFLLFLVQYIGRRVCAP